MKKLLYIFLAVMIFCVSSYQESYSQIRYYRYYSGPQGTYEYKNFGNGSFSVPNGNDFYYNNGNNTQMQDMMQQLDRLMQQYFSSNSPLNNDFNSNFNAFSLSPQMPDIFSSGSIPYQVNPYMPQTLKLTPAPDYKSAPELYY